MSHRILHDYSMAQDLIILCKKEVLETCNVELREPIVDDFWQSMSKIRVDYGDLSWNLTQCLKNRYDIERRDLGDMEMFRWNRLKRKMLSRCAHYSNLVFY